MPVIISPALVLSEIVEGGPDAPLIGWQNLVAVGAITADEEDADHPATNLANPSTALRWQAETTGDQYITFDIDPAAAVDYVGIARHNLGSGQVTVSVEIPDADNPGDWIEVGVEMIPAGDQPIVIHFEEVFPGGQVRLRLQPTATIPRIAVVYIGRLLRLQRGLQPGLVPLPWAAADDVVSSESEAGDYLGAIVLRQSLSNSVSIQRMDYDWWRSEMPGFIAHARQRKPFFFAWLPATYPDEVGYAWSINDIRPEMRNDLEVDISLSLKAVAL